MCHDNRRDNHHRGQYHRQDCSPALPPPETDEGYPPEYRVGHQGNQYSQGQYPHHGAHLPGGKTVIPKEKAYDCEGNDNDELEYTEG